MAWGSITIMTDGACLYNGQPGAVGGIGVYFPDGELDDISSPLWGKRQTNQRAEIIAALVGIRAARRAGYEDITVQLDSAYVANVMNNWRYNWIKHNWSGNIVNKDDFIRLHNATVGVDVTFEKISRDDNDEADTLAKQAARAAAQDDSDSDYY